MIQPGRGPSAKQRLDETREQKPWGMGSQMRRADFIKATIMIVAIGLSAWVALSGDANAASLFSPGAASLVRKSTEPFGLMTAPLPYGSVRDKWADVQRHLDDEMVQLALCDGDREHCVSEAALRLLSIVDSGREREGRARLGEINRAINLAIRPLSDLAQYGKDDIWSSPLVTFAHGAGDCEDYAIAKYAALRLAGIAPEDLRVLIIHETFRNEEHALTAVRFDGHWLTLDNRRMAMIEDDDMRQYRPGFVMGPDGVNYYENPPALADESSPTPEPQFVALISP